MITLPGLSPLIKEIKPQVQILIQSRTDVANVNYKENSLKFLRMVRSSLTCRWVGQGVFMEEMLSALGSKGDEGLGK